MNKKNFMNTKELDLRSDFQKKITEKELKIIDEYHRLYKDGANQMKVFSALAIIFGYKNGSVVKSTFVKLKKKYPEKFKI